MPGKYSHSVVLADYSSRGVIVLPPDQRIKYANSAPQNRGPSASSMRLRGTRSAQTMYRPPTSTLEGWDTLDLDRPHPSLSTHAAQTRTRVNVSIDDDEETFKPLRYSGYYDQMPHSTPTVNVVSQPQTEPRSAYERQQSRNDAKLFQATKTVPSSNRISDSQPQQQAVNRKEELIPSFSRDQNSNVSLRKDQIASWQPSFTTNDGNKVNQSRALERPAGPSNSASQNQSSIVAAKSSKAQTGKEEAGRVAASSSTDRGRLEDPENWPRPPQSQPRTGKEPQQQKSKELLQKPQQQQTRSSEREGPVSDKGKQLTYATAQEQGRRIEDVPSFEGFSDTDEGPAGYFEVPKQRIAHNRDESVNFTLPIQKPEPQTHSRSPLRRDDAAPAAPLRTISMPDGRKTPSRAPVPSAAKSPQGPTSSSLVSSPKLANGHFERASSSRKESPRVSVHPSSPEQKWGLPEIQEDHGFSPSIFEDNEGDTSKFSLDDFDVIGSIGQISSGKDVSFDNDAASELSAAMPPPISRFKDEEDEFNANMIRLFGDGAEVISKKNSGTFTRWPSAKKSFFSKFRSKS